MQQVHGGVQVIGLDTGRNKQQISDGGRENTPRQEVKPTQTHKGIKQEKNDERTYWIAESYSNWWAKHHLNLDIKMYTHIESSFNSCVTLAALPSVLLITLSVFVLQLAMEATPSVKAARCAPGTTAVWTANPSSSCFCGERGWGNTGSACSTVRPDTTACAPLKSTCAPVSTHPPASPPIPVSPTLLTFPSFPPKPHHPQSRNTHTHPPCWYQRAPLFPITHDILSITQRRHTYLWIWTALTQVDVSREASSKQRPPWDSTAKSCSDVLISF